MKAAERRGTAPDAVYATLITGLLCLAGAWVVFGPMHDWVRYPLSYTDQRDALANLWVIKTVMETGSAYGSPALGAPFGALFFDFPRPEVLFLLFYRAAGRITDNVSLVHNLFYLAGFPLVAWSALAVLRRELHVAWPLAAAGAIVFCWLPYHFLRLEHLHLSNYVAVPIAAWLMLRVGGERPPFFERGRLGAAAPAVWLAAVLVAVTSIYYAFFAVILIAGVGAIQGIAVRSWRPAASALLVVASIGTVLSVALIPVLRYRAAAGANPAVAARSVAENDFYSLRPIHLVLPSASHTSARLASFSRTYNGPASYPNENQFAALGLIGAVGFVLLLLHLLTGDRVLPATPGVATLARANLVAVLFGVSGGVGALVAVLVTPQFRALNRISVFVAFFSIAAVMIAIDRAIGRLGAMRERATYVLAAAVVTVAFVDQRTMSRPAVAHLATTFDSDRAFVERIESLLPHDAMVYQVPYTRFPEVPPLHREPFYSPMRMFVHSRALRWSYGGMKGRPGDYWHQALDRLPLPDRLARIRATGFAGLVLDRAALPDAGVAHDQALAALGAVDRFESRDATLAFYRFPEAVTGTNPLAPLWVAGRGFYQEERDLSRQWNWSEGNAEMYIHHRGTEGLPVELTCVLRSLSPRQVLVRSSDGSSRAATIAGAGLSAPVRLRFSLVPGWNTVRFETDTPAVHPEGSPDPRRLAFMLAELQVRHATTGGQEPRSR